MDDEHIPVLLDEAIAALNIQPEGFYVDATFGCGGHSLAILQRLHKNGHLLAFDKDPDAVQSIKKIFRQDHRFRIIQGSFTMLTRQVRQLHAAADIHGILLDLGVSSMQLDNPVRGFSFRFEAPLDMRMDPNKGQSAADFLKTSSEADIADVIFQYGEEHAAKKIAREIVAHRNTMPIHSTKQLADLIVRVKKKQRGIHPATKTFQALRIFINRELDELRQVLEQALALLAPGGRLVVISFHSLEDRIVKRFMRREARPATLPNGLPVMPDQQAVKLRLIGKKIRATQDEVLFNPRSRSAILRIAERLPV